MIANLVHRQREGWLPDREELIDEGSDSTPERSHKPDSEGADGELPVVDAAKEGEKESENSTSDQDEIAASELSEERRTYQGTTALTSG